MTTATRNGPQAWQESQSPNTRAIFGKVRRMVLGVTSRIMWQVIGHMQLDGKLEARDAEVFGGAGYINRPGGRNAEAIVIFPGEGAMSPIVVAIRDQEMAAALAAALTGGALAKGESAMGAGVDGTVAGFVHVRANGTVEIRTPGGTPVALALKSDVQEVVTKFNAHNHTVPIVGAAGTTFSTTPLPAIASAPVGTTCIKSH